jgi:hypothetical protein
LNAPLALVDFAFAAIALLSCSIDTAATRAAYGSKHSGRGYAAASRDNGHGGVGARSSRRPCAGRATLIVDLHLVEASSPTPGDVLSAGLGSSLARLEERARTLHKESHRSRRAPVGTRKTC